MPQEKLRTKFCYRVSFSKKWFSAFILSTLHSTTYWYKMLCIKFSTIKLKYGILISRLVFEKIVFKVGTMFLRDVKVQLLWFFAFISLTLHCKTFLDRKQNVPHKICHKKVYVWNFDTSSHFRENGVQRQHNVSDRP